MLCYCDYMWKEMKACRVGGAESMRLPFDCPMDHVLPPSTPLVTTGNHADLPGSSATPTSDAVPPLKSASSTFDSSPALGKRAAVSRLGVKLQRTLWGNNPEKLERLRKAVADWD